MADFERVLVPGLTHWNHPGFFAYFAITASAPGVLAEFLSAALNQQAMLWRTSPAATELEDVALGWLRAADRPARRVRGRHLRHRVDLDAARAGRGARGGRARACARSGLAGRADVPRAARLLLRAGALVDRQGGDRARPRPRVAPARFRATASSAMRPDALATRDRRRPRARRCCPIAVVATVGTTSTTSVDPVRGDRRDLRGASDVWLHVDAAYAGVAAMRARRRARILDGAERADSLVVNPHKWLFTPFDLSAFYCRRMDVLRAAFSLTPEYLKTPERGRGPEPDGHRRAARPPVPRAEAVDGAALLRRATASARGSREHMRLARLFAVWVDAQPISSASRRCRSASSASAAVPPG